MLILHVFVKIFILLISFFCAARSDCRSPPTKYCRIKISVSHAHNWNGEMHFDILSCRNNSPRHNNSDGHSFGLIFVLLFLTNSLLFHALILLCSPWDPCSGAHHPGGRHLEYGGAGMKEHTKHKTNRENTLCFISLGLRASDWLLTLRWRHGPGKLQLVPNFSKEKKMKTNWRCLSCRRPCAISPRRDWTSPRSSSRGCRTRLRTSSQSV